MTIAGLLRMESDRLVGLRTRMQSRSARAVAGTAGVNLVSTILLSVGGIFLARELGSTDRGNLVAVLQWPAVFGSLASLGLTQATCYWVSRHREHGAAIMKTAGRAALLTGCGVIVIGFLVAPALGRRGDVVTLIRVVMLMSPVFIAGGVWMSTLQAIHIRAWNQARFIQPAFYFAAIVTLAVAGQLRLRTTVGAFCFSLAIQGLYARFSAHAALRADVQHPASYLRPLYRYGVQVWAASIPQLINVRLDQLALTVIPDVTAADLGVYAVSASLSWLALPLAVAFGAVAFPAMSGSTSEAARRRIERSSLVGSGAAAGAVLLVICAAAPVAIPRVFGEEYREATTCLWLLAPGTVFLALNRVMTGLLQGRGRPLSTSFGEGTAAVVTVALLLLVTPHFGIRGAAAVSSVAYVCAAAVLYWRLRIERQRAPSQSVIPVGPIGPWQP